MSETLTVDTTPDTEVLTEDEQESLEIGEQMEAAQDNLLAGKYKDAQELEKAYIELQGKLGASEETEEEPTYEPEEEEEETTTEASSDVLDRLWNELQNDDVTDETMQELYDSDPKDIADSYMQYRNSNAQTPLTEEDTAALKGVVGGEEEYGTMINWAQDNLSEQEIQMYDAVMDKQDPLSCFFAVQALTNRYQDAQGIEGEMLTGKPAANTHGMYRSQAQVVEAMSDPKYDNDPAYRQEVMKKLERSDLQF